jgi:hypothetical protein
LRKATRAHHLPASVAALHDRYVRLGGEIAAVAIETAEDDSKIDHVWITVRAGELGRLQISMSTCSRHNRAAGFDSRVRVGTIESAWSELPEAGVREVPPLDYANIEAKHPVEYIEHDRPAMERLLVEKSRRAIFAEAWGDFYVRTHIGVHQVHSRRGSFGVPRDVVGRDGAVQFYYREPGVREMLLLKFAGQA